MSYYGDYSTDYDKYKNWGFIPEDIFHINYSDSGYSATRRLTLQYDRNTVSPEKMKVVFKWYEPNNSKVYGVDTMYLLYDANNSSELRSLYKIKGYESGEVKAYYTEPITLTKDYNAKSFFLQDIWICNNGKNVITTTASAFYDAFKSGGSRGGYAYRQTSGQSISIDALEDDTAKVTATDGSKPTVSITDNGNNKCTISGVLGKKGTNNAFKSATLYYTTDGSDPSSSSTRTKVSLTDAASGEKYAKEVTVSKACTVKAYTVCKFTYNETNASASKAIIYYAAPKNPGVPKLSYKKSRLTVKEPWTFTWTAATQSNTSSPVKGYYLMLLRRPAATPEPEGDAGDGYVFVRELTCSTSNNYIGIDKGSNSNVSTNYYIRRENTSCTAIFEDPTKFGFKPGDKVKLRIRAFTRNAKGSPGEILQSGQVDSAEYEVRNAGIVHVKVNDTWREGQVYVKVNSAWKEAELVSTKVSDSWREAE